MFCQKMKMDQNDRTGNEQILISRTCQRWGNDPLPPSLPSTSADQFKTNMFYNQTSKWQKQTASHIKSGKSFGLVTILFGGNKMLPFF